MAVVTGLAGLGTAAVTVGLPLALSRRKPPPPVTFNDGPTDEALDARATDVQELVRVVVDLNAEVRHWRGEAEACWSREARRDRDRRGGTP